MVLLTMLAVVTVAIISLKDLFGVVILAGIYSFLMATVFVLLDAVDVAMTEASVGAGISTVLLLGTLYLTGARSTGSLHTGGIALLMSAVTGGALVYGTMFLPNFGDANAPIHTHVADRYLAQSIPETTVPNVVTSVLGSYRGFDTLGEVIVVFTAAIGVLMLLGGPRRFGTQTADEAVGDWSEMDATAAPAKSTPDETSASSDQQQANASSQSSSSGGPSGGAA